MLNNDLDVKVIWILDFGFYIGIVINWCWKKMYSQ